MLNQREIIFLIHIFFVGPLLIYLGYFKDKANKMVFNVVLILGIVVSLYHLYLLSISIKNKKQYNQKVI